MLLVCMHQDPNEVCTLHSVDVTPEPLTFFHVIYLGRRCGRPIHPCGLSLGSVCEHRLLPLAKDTLPYRTSHHPLVDPILAQLLWRGMVPQAPRRNHAQVPVLKTDHPDALPTESCEMGTQDPKAEQGLWVPPPGLLHPGWGHPALERPALPLLHAGHAEPAPDAEPGQPRGLPRGPGTPGSGWRVRPFQFPGAGLHRDLPRRLLRDPQGGQSDHVPVQRPGQPHVLGQHSHLPGLGHCGRQTLTQQGCSQPFPAHLSPTWGPTDRASRWPKQPDVWKPQKVQGAGIPRASARQPERRPSPRHASPTGLLLTALVALIYMVAIVYEEPFTAEIYQQKASQAYKRS
ncbi:phosphatidylethanolamine N-methyltransferase isoform X2 [Bos indicus]|uniref:Phosphatidylethanolamine N-methyltransferase isoform X2 n=1 Tax=Bos indicus TaxID=9915 RepID=A0ABM4R164_BOSIN